MIKGIPGKFPTIPKVGSNSFTKTKIRSIKKKIEKIEEIWDDGEFVADRIDELNSKLLNHFTNWLKDPDLLEDSKILVDPDFVAEMFMDYALNYEGEIESGLKYIDSFLYSHFIRKSWAEDETYLWDPFALNYFIHFLYYHDFIDENSCKTGSELIITSYDKYYSNFRR